MTSSINTSLQTTPPSIAAAPNPSDQTPQVDTMAIRLSKNLILSNREPTWTRGISPACDQSAIPLQATECLLNMWIDLLVLMLYVNFLENQGDGGEFWGCAQGRKHDDAVMQPNPQNLTIPAVVLTNWVMTSMTDHQPKSVLFDIGLWKSMIAAPSSMWGLGLLTVSGEDGSWFIAGKKVAQIVDYGGHTVVTSAQDMCPKFTTGFTLLGPNLSMGFTLLGPSFTMGFTLLGPNKIEQHKEVSFPAREYPDHAESPNENGSATSA